MQRIQSTQKAKKYTNKQQNNQQTDKQTNKQASKKKNTTTTKYKKKKTKQTNKQTLPTCRDMMYGRMTSTAAGGLDQLIFCRVCDPDFSIVRPLFSCTKSSSSPPSPDR
jgi:hypothetical protein